MDGRPSNDTDAGRSCGAECCTGCWARGRSGSLHVHTACNSSTPACPALPNSLKQTLSGAMSVARQLLPSAQAQLHSMSPTPHKSVRPLTGTQRRAQKASLQKAAGAAVQAAAEAGAQLPQRCAHCGKAAVGLRRCAQCRRAEASYCRWWQGTGWCSLFSEAWWLCHQRRPCDALSQHLPKQSTRPARGAPLTFCSIAPAAVARARWRPGPSTSLNAGSHDPPNICTLSGAVQFGGLCIKRKLYSEPTRELNCPTNFQPA